MGSLAVDAPAPKPNAAFRRPFAALAQLVGASPFTRMRRVQGPQSGYAEFVEYSAPADTTSPGPLSSLARWLSLSFGRRHAKVDDDTHADAPLHSETSASNAALAAIDAAASGVDQRFFLKESRSDPDLARAYIQAQQEKLQKQPASRALLLALLMVGIFLPFMARAALTEYIFRSRKFHFSWFGGLVEGLVFVVASYYGKLREGQPGIRFNRDALLLVMSIGASFLGARVLTLFALRFIGYPTVAMLKSSKVLLAMAFGIAVNRKHYRLKQYLSATLLCIGASTFTVAAKSLEPTFDPLGIVLVTLSMSSETIVATFQERLMRHYEMPMHEMLFQSNLLGFAIALGATFVSGEMSALMELDEGQSGLIKYVFLSAIIGYVGTLFWTKLIKEFCADTAMIVGVCRKVLTIIVSYIIFPKPISPMGIVGVAVFTAGLYYDVRFKREKRRAARATAEV